MRSALKYLSLILFSLLVQQTIHAAVVDTVNTYSASFGAAGSMSGDVDIRPFPNNWDMALGLGTYSEHPGNWEKYTVINILHLLQPNSLAVLIDCGTEDFFYKVNENLHQQLLYRNIPHDYITRPGAHNWNYWINAIQYQLLFMNNYFKSQMK